MREKIGKGRYIYLCIYTFLCCFILIGVFLTESAHEWFELLSSIETQDYTMIFVWLYILAAVLCAFKMRKIITYTKKEAIIFLFFLAFFPRFLLALQQNYIPSSDFKQYYEAGVHFAEGNLESVKEFVGRYGIPKFSGLAVFMGIIAKLFSVRLLGFQIANAIITALISVFIFLCIENSNKRAAVIAGMLFAVYPANIVSAQITTNHHGAILFTLIGIFCVLKAAEKKGGGQKICVFAGGAAFAVSDFIHPSVIVPIIAVGCYGIVAILAVKKNWSRFKCSIGVIICYFLTVYFIFAILSKMGTLDGKATITEIPYSKIIVGLNQDTRGTYSEEDYTATNNMSDAQRRQWIRKELTERILEQTPNDVIQLLRDKMDMVWFKQDSYFWWYWGEWNNSIENGLNSGTLSEEAYWKEMDKVYACTSYARFDWIFLRVIYFLALVGIISLLIKGEDGNIELVVWVLLGWILVHMIIEVQERYRYVGMPYIFILAGFGMESIGEVYSGIKRLRK